jgi:two-component system cell cycle response regulator
MALCAPPAALIAELWMPSISGVQLCRLLRAEPATADVPVILRGPSDDPRSHFWAERAGALAYVVKGRMSELVRVLSRAVVNAPSSDGFFMQLSGDGGDIRDRIARHLDAALFESVIAAEVRALASATSFERLFDAFSQFLSQVISYRWLALSTTSPGHFALHHHPGATEKAELEARNTLGIAADKDVLRVVDEDARDDAEGPAPIVCEVLFGNARLATLALAPSPGCEADTSSLASLAARELAGPLRIAALVEESQRLATTDPLTGLMNRRAFLAMMQEEIARSSRYQLPLSLLLLDVDHFKSINDTFGHAVGDQVLSSIGKLLQNALRTSDTPARWGGEEFVIALKNTPLDGGAIAAERLRAALTELRIEAGGTTVKVTASLGLACLSLNESVDTLIDRADRAMYAAKVGGRNRLVVGERAGCTVAESRVVAASA